jgi:phosphotransferase system enzyme I (PtsI)
LEILDSAIAKTQKQLERIKVLSKEKLGEEKSSIFDAHIQIANDPEMLNQIKEKMVGERVNLVKIIDDVFGQYHEMFTKMDDPYFKERASDLIDVKERILCNVLDIEIPNLLEIKTPSILISNNLQPSNVALLDPKFVKGIISEVGGKTSHSAIMARSFEIPGVFGAKNILNKVKNGQFVGLDGKAGMIDLNPDKKVWLTKIEKYNEMVAEFAKYIKLETKTLDGKKIKCEANIGNISDADGANKYGCEGVGLYRTEFLYMGKNN